MNRFSDINYSNKRLPPVYGFRSEKLVSLETALKLIESQIDELPYDIKIAKKHCRYPSEQGLSKDQSAAIYIYTMEWGDTTLYRVLNQALRSENRQALKIWFAYLKLFDTALDLLPTVKESVWRGVPLDIGKNFTKNQLVTWWSVSSCSSSPDVIQKFLVAGYTEYENEDEVILRIGTQFSVKGNPLKQSNGSHIVHLIEVDDNDDEPMAAAISKVHSFHYNQYLFLINNFILPPLLRASAIDIPPNVTWKQNGKTVAGGNGNGNEVNQLSYPYGLFVDNNQTIYITDNLNHRIMEWKSGATKGKVVAGRNGQENGTHQLNNPRNVIVDKEKDDLIISDTGNKRVVRWFRRNDGGNTSGETVISNIDCYGLTMDENGFLYVVDTRKHEVKRYRMDGTDGKVVAGGNGKEGSLTQITGPEGVVVDQLGTVYVADEWNHRIMRWTKGSTEGSVIVGGKGYEGQPNHLNYPVGLSFDRHGKIKY